MDTKECYKYLHDQGLRWCVEKKIIDIIVKEKEKEKARQMHGLLHL